MYRLESILGRGGMGVVFRAHDEQTQRPVAVKILRPELAMQHATFAKRFVREAKAAAAIKHPNVVEVYDVGTEADGTAFQVLALLEGETLRDHLARKGKLSLAMTLDVLLPVMHALEAAHAASIVHRDLKPDNIFLARLPNGDVVPTLLDFGIAKLLEGHESFATNTGSILGTPSYMAPEQATGARVQGIGIDIWAMGIIVYECLAGAPPFTGTSPPHVMLKIMTENPAPLDELVPTVPRAVADVVSQALLRSLSERYASMNAFREALREAATQSDVTIPEVGRVSTVTAMSIAPPASSDGIDLSLALDSVERPRVEQDAATVAATGAASRPLRAVAAPSQATPPQATPPQATPQTVEPAPRRPLLWLAAVAALVAVLAAAWAVRSPEPTPMETGPEARHTAPPTPAPVTPEAPQAEQIAATPEVVAPMPIVAPAPEEPVVPVVTARPGRHPRPRAVSRTEAPTTAAHESEPTMETAPRNGLPGVVAW